MNFATLVEEYIAFKRSHGMRFRTQATVLRQFCRALGPVQVQEVTAAAVREFLYRNKVITMSWHQTYSNIKRLYQYLITRGYTTLLPLPTTLPKKPGYGLPYIYSIDELQKLLAATPILDAKHKVGEFSVAMFRTFLTLLYGTGLRSGEAVSLTVDDVNLAERLLTIRNTKFFKSRLVPIGPKLTVVLEDYFKRRCETFGKALGEASFFLNNKGYSLPQQVADRYFRLIREHVGIKRNDGAYFQPRMHDLRHTFAVHRLVRWYEDGANVQKLLPQLSTYLGHIRLAETQVYLTMTPELLREANRRFENYALSEVSHVQ